jgi:hypothetical protein
MNWRPSRFDGTRSRLGVTGHHGLSAVIQSRRLTVNPVALAFLPVNQVVRDEGLGRPSGRIGWGGSCEAYVELSYVTLHVSDAGVHCSTTA